MPLNIESLVITPTDNTDVSNIVFPLNQDKNDGPNSIPTKILKLLNKDISDQSFPTNVFLLDYFFQFWEQVKLFINKKGSKLECANFTPIDKFG